MNSAKEYLMQIGELEERIKQKEIQLQCLRETAGGVSAIRYDKDRVQTTILTDPIGRNMEKVFDLEERILLDKLELETFRNKIINEIHETHDERYIKVLFKRYVEHKTYELIAVECHYTYDYTRVLHSEALRAFGKIKNFTEP